jgi:cell division protein FtsB
VKKQEIFDEISTLDLASLQDDSLKNTFELMLNLIEDLQQEALKLKAVNQSLRDEINQLKGEQGRPTIKPNTKSDSRDISTQGKRA